MSFKTSVLIWFSRSRGTASPPAPLLQRGGAPKGVRLFFIRKKDTDKDIVTYEHKVIVTEFLDIMPLSLQQET